ncbi:MAG: hypothetical protein OXQ94_02865 [Gemmatimonadota bacterium]|nr:hypothetical protein [Gemmatimonadota bacterium]MDE2870619.1 hypothetical protein [Gemmatimonadota bacterium]
MTHSSLRRGPLASVVLAALLALACGSPYPPPPDTARFVEDELGLLTNLDALRNRIVAVDPASPDPDPANWRVVLPEADDLLTGYWYTSADGTRGPLYVAHRKGYEPAATRPRCSTATAASTSTSCSVSIRGPRCGWSGAASTRSRRCGAAASSARTGTATALPVILDYDPRAGPAGGRTFSRSVRNAAMELAFHMGRLGVEGEGE